MNQLYIKIIFLTACFAFLVEHSQQALSPPKNNFATFYNHKEPEKILFNTSPLPFGSRIFRNVEHSDVELRKTNNVRHSNILTFLSSPIPNIPMGKPHHEQNSRQTRKNRKLKKIKRIKNLLPSNNTVEKMANSGHSQNNKPYSYVQRTNFVFDPNLFQNERVIHHDVLPFIEKTDNTSHIMSNFTQPNGTNEAQRTNANFQRSPFFFELFHTKLIGDSQPEKPQEPEGNRQAAKVTGTIDPPETIAQAKRKNINSVVKNNESYNTKPSENTVPSTRPTIDQNGITTVDDPLPCLCYRDNKKCGCDCVGSLSYDQFQKLASSFQPCWNFSFTITGGSHFSLPPNLFTRIGSVQHLNLKIVNATFDYLFDPTPGTSSFRGVSFTKSGVLQLSGVKVRRGWNWSSLQFLMSSSGPGADVEVKGCGLRRLSSDFSKVADGAVGSLTITGSSLEMVGSGAFSSFDGLIHFRLPDNKLKFIKRSDFPPKPRELVDIDLRNNQLQSLEADMFTEMPSIRVISLSGNPLLMLSEETFSRVIGKTEIPGILNFPLYCDCHLQWLKNATFKKNAMVQENMKDLICRRPSHLRGTPFKVLSKEHLIC